MRATYYQKNRDVILSKAKDYNKNDKERLRKQATNKYRTLSEEKKMKKREYGKILQYVWRKETNTKRISNKTIARQKKSQYNNEQNSFLIVILILITIQIK